MQKKIKRTIGFIVGTLVVVMFVIWACWLPVTTSWLVRRSADRFHDMYQPGGTMYACISEDEFVMWFAGTKGLPEIERLSRDESLIPSGRSTASNLFAYISSGRHLPSARYMLANNPYLIGRQFWKYVLKNDSIYLMKKGLTIQNGESKQGEQGGGEERR